MILFLGGLALLVVGYFTYGRLVECIAEDAKAFLRASGVNQWQRGTYPDRALFASDVASGIGWVLADGGLVCAVCAVTFDDEPSYRHLVKGAWLTGDEPARKSIRRCPTLPNALSIPRSKPRRWRCWPRLEASFESLQSEE